MIRRGWLWRREPRNWADVDPEVRRQDRKRTAARMFQGAARVAWVVAGGLAVIEIVRAVCGKMLIAVWTSP